MITPADKDLLEAARCGDAAGVKAALAAGAEPNRAQDSQGRTPLNYAAAVDMAPADRADIFEALVSHKADPDRGDHDGFTPMHEAAAYGHRDAIGFLLNAGADIDRHADNGTTPLHSAVNVALSTGKTLTVAFLLAQGAEASLRDGAGKRPLDVAHEYAARSEHGPAIVSFLENYKPGQNPLVEAAQSETAETNVRDDWARAAAAETQSRLRALKLKSAPRLKL